MFRSSASIISGASKACKRTFATYKTSTGLVGLAVDPNGRETLLNLSAQIKEAVKPIPSSSQYRINVERWFNYIEKTANEMKDVKQIENEIALGQIEEVIEMAKDELKLIDIYIEGKGWEQVAEEQRDADAMIADMADSMYFTNTLPPK